MKTLLTLIALYRTDADEPCEGVEIIYSENNESEKDFVTRAIKAAKGKYAVLIHQKFKLADVNSLLNLLDKNSPDMFVFVGGTAIKTSVVKGAVKDCEDMFSCFILSVLSCKTILKSLYTPFLFIKSEVTFDEVNYSGLLIASEEFSSKKAKLSKDIYSHAMNALCSRLVNFYLVAMVAIKEGRLDGKKLIDFDGRLKAEIVLYLTLEQNFTGAKLTKLRKKGFRISGLTAKKFRKLLNAQ